MAAFFRIASTSGRARGQVASFTMAGSGRLQISLPIGYFRIGVLRTSLTGATGVITMAGRGSMFVSPPTNAYFRVGVIGGFVPFDVRTYTGTAWGESVQQSINFQMVGVGHLSLASQSLGTGAGVPMVGTGTMTVAGALASVLGVQMDASGDMLISDQPAVVSGSVQMDGLGFFGVDGLVGMVTLIYYFTPPTYTFKESLRGSLVFGIRRSTVVYRQDGTWHNQLDAGVDDPVVSLVDVDPSGVALYFDRPSQVPESLLTELFNFAIVPADPSWDSGTLTAVAT